MVVSEPVIEWITLAITLFLCMWELVSAVAYVSCCVTGSLGDRVDPHSLTADCADITVYLQV